MSACNSAPRKEGETTKAATGEVAAAPNTLTEQEKKEGWILMFDGETTNGWREYDAEVFPDTGWYIEDGCLVCENSGNGRGRIWWRHHL